MDGNNFDIGIFSPYISFDHNQRLFIISPTVNLSKFSQLYRNTAKSKIRYSILKRLFFHLLTHYISTLIIEKKNGHRD